MTPSTVVLPLLPFFRHSIKRRYRGRGGGGRELEGRGEGGRQVKCTSKVLGTETEENS